MADMSLKSLSVDLTQNLPQPDFVNLDQKLSCIKCKNLPLSPMQLPCGHRICAECSDKLKSAGNQELQCPSREEECEKFSPNDIYPDFSAKREIRQLPVFCSYKRFGCNHTMPWLKLKDHIDQCKYRNVICNYCKQEYPAELYENHINYECEQFPCPCPYNCGDVGNIKRFQLENHKKNCRLKPKLCRYNDVGCKFEAVESVLMAHEADYKLHLDVAVQHSLTLHQQINILKESLTAATSNIESLQSDVIKLNNDKEQLEEKLTVLEKDFKQSKDRQTDILSNQVSRIDGVTKAVDKVNQDFQLIRVKQNQQDTKISDLEKMDKQRRLSVALPEDVRTQFIQHDRTIGLHDLRISELDLRCQCLQTANYEGVLMWKIADYHKRKQEAIDGNILSLYSQPFYTSRYGYKMCGRVYLNGDGIGKGTHLSLFFVVMQGDYDDILLWPFRQKVTLTLLDQKNNRRHTSDTFRPDPNSNSFQKPKTPMNVASGCPLFVAHSTLEDKDELYLRNNTIYIKVTVDTSDLMNP